MPANAENAAPAAVIAHGADQLSRVTVDAYNSELRQGQEFIGDRASKRAFQAILDDWRDRVSKAGEDPFGDIPTEEISKKQLDKVLSQGDPEAAGVVQSAIEDFAQEFAAVTRRLMRLKDWRGTERIVVGGGLRGSRFGELAIGRASVLLKSNGCKVDLHPIRHHPDEAGLLGAIHLVPTWILSGHNCILAVDIGGTNIRAGLVQFEIRKKSEITNAEVPRSELWCHREDAPKREDAVARLIGMLEDLIKHAAKQKLKLAPFIGIGCPGVILHDGAIDRGGQNLPGNWESKTFNLPQQIREAIPHIAEHDTMVVMHNDAVVQGLSELEVMQDVEHWGVLTIGTGLGNARFTNRPSAKESREDDRK